VALTVNINGRSRTLNSLARATVNDRPQFGLCLDYAVDWHRLSVK